MLPPFLQTALQKELAPGEKIIWQGRPSATLSNYVTTAVFTLVGGIFFSLLIWLAFTELPLVYKSRGILLSSIVSALGVLGIYMAGSFMFSPLWLWMRLNYKVYAITNQRAIILEVSMRSSSQTHCEVFLPSQLYRIQVKQRSHGRGDLILHYNSILSNHGRVHKEPVGFICIDDVAYVKGLVLKLAQGRLNDQISAS